MSINRAELRKQLNTTSPQSPQTQSTDIKEPMTQDAKTKRKLKIALFLVVLGLVLVIIFMVAHFMLEANLDRVVAGDLDFWDLIISWMAFDLIKDGIDMGGAGGVICIVVGIVILFFVFLGSDSSSHRH